ncbi:MAG: hypothetical protein AAGB04_31450 [Pseudomonadota bacterium]
MYEIADDELLRIAKLAESCPELYREKAFEILLQGYVTSLVSPHVAAAPAVPPDPIPQGDLPPIASSTDDSWREGIPQEVLPRFQSMAMRLKVAPSGLADVFDFTMDPFTFAAVNVEGKSKTERVLRVAVLVAARSYLATGRWIADWAEVKAMCTHQNCYDVNNFSSTLNRAAGDWFKKVSSGASVQPSATGQKEAEAVLAKLAGGSGASE